MIKDEPSNYEGLREFKISYFLSYTNLPAAEAWVIRVFETNDPPERDRFYNHDTQTFTDHIENATYYTEHAARKIAGALRLTYGDNIIPFAPHARESIEEVKALSLV